MNKIFLLILIIVSVSSCGQMGNNEFLIKGKIDNSVGKTIFLSEVKDNGMVTIDSVLIGKNGDFKLKGKTSFPKFYRLRFSPNEYITLLVDSANIISISADANDFVKTHKAEGTNDIILIKKLEDRMALTQTQIDSLGKVYQSFIGKPSLDSAKAGLDKKFNEIVVNQKEYSKKFVETNSKSMVSMLALSQQIIPGRFGVFGIPEDFAYFEKVDAELFKLYPQSKDVQSLRDFITKVKAQQNQQTDVKGKTYGIGDVVPDISLNNPSGKIISLYSLRGKYVLLDFWAGWCKPCRMENPNLVEAYKKYKANGFEIFQVSLDKDKARWLEAIEKDQLSGWLHVSDLQFWQSAPAKAYNITSIPANFLLNPKGEVVAKDLRGNALNAKLQEIFKF